VVAAFGLDERATLLGEDGERLAGLDQATIAAAAAAAKVRLQHQRPPAAGSLPAPRWVYVDLDPAFTQIWHADQSLPSRSVATTTT